MRIIETRLPQGARPIFWTNIGDNRLGPEFLAVECSLWVAEDSMSAFPNADKTLQPGARIFVVTEQRDVIPGASYVLALKKMPTRVVSQDSVNYQDVTYWVTQLEVLPQTIENLRGGFALLPASDLVLHWDSSTNEHGKPMLRSQRLTLPGSGIFQFEVRVHADAGITRIGALASDDRTWLEQSDASVRDGNDWVSWFRLAGEKDKTFELALEASSTASAARLLAEPPSVTILQDGATEHSPIAFEYLSPHHSSVSNLIANGGFEGGLSGWANDQGVLRLATECHRGACAEYAAPAGTWSWVAHWQAAKLKIGDTYEFSAWLRSKGSRSQEVVMGIWDQPAGQWVAKNTITLSPSWTQFRMRFKNSAPGWISMNFLTNPQTPRTFLLDEVSIHEVASPQ
jgi:hypothetical protein